jgi:hypothetical protein
MEAYLPRSSRWRRTYKSNLQHLEIQQASGDVKHSTLGADQVPVIVVSWLGTEMPISHDVDARRSLSPHGQKAKPLGRLTRRVHWRPCDKHGFFNRPTAVTITSLG